MVKNLSIFSVKSSQRFVTSMLPMYIRNTFYFFHFSIPFYSGPPKDAEKSPNHGTYFDFALGISYKVLFPVLDRPTAQFKTACPKFRNVIELSTDIVKQI